jgi:hypothetical protein
VKLTRPGFGQPAEQPRNRKRDGVTRALAADLLLQLRRTFVFVALKPKIEGLTSSRRDNVIHRESRGGETPPAQQARCLRSASPPEAAFPLPR